MHIGRSSFESSEPLLQRSPRPGWAVLAGPGGSTGGGLIFGISGLRPEFGSALRGLGLTSAGCPTGVRGSGAVGRSTCSDPTFVTVRVSVLLGTFAAVQAAANRAAETTRAGSFITNTVTRPAGIPDAQATGRRNPSNPGPAHLTSRLPTVTIDASFTGT